jgi:hypothetical protein
LCLGPGPWLLWFLGMTWGVVQLRPCELALDWLQASALVLAGLGLALALALFAFGAALIEELRRGLAQNEWGLCRGKAVPLNRGDVATEPALVDWLHEAIQRSAGREPDDPPLTFVDLWRAPRFGQPMGPAVEGYAAPPLDPSIGLHMFSTNLSHGRPVRWPLNDPNTRLYFKPQEWQAIFPAAVLGPLLKASRPYAPASKSDPEDDGGAGLYELPCGDLPIVVAARLSLSFPVLFSCVPVWAVDYEQPRGRRKLRRALLTDGGVCTNFPVHLFDAAHPRWPTFALLLDKRLTAYADDRLFLPKGHAEGRADNWQDGRLAEERRARGVFGLVTGLLQTALDWNDRTAMRLPHVRNRVIRYALQDGEGQLYINMSRQTMLKMAHGYGPRAAQELINAFDTGDDGDERQPFWRQHLFVRAMSEYRALQLHLRGYAQAVHANRHSVPLHRLLREAQLVSPLRGPEGQPQGPTLTPEQAEALIDLSRRIEELAQALERAAPAIDAYLGKPVAELRLRVPI